MLVAAACGAFVALKFSTGTRLSENFLQQKIRENFSERILRIRATQGDILELAVLESAISFEMSDEWQTVPAGLGKTVSRIRVPAVFRFFVKISDPISIQTNAQGEKILCTVFAPALQPILPVAFDTSRMQRERDVGLLRFNGEELSDALQKKLSLRLAFAAKTHAKTAAVHDAARLAFEKFTLAWMQEVRKLKEMQGKELVVRVVFADEVPVSAQQDFIDEENGGNALAPVPVTL